MPAGGYSRRRLVEGDWLFLGLLIVILATAYLLTGLRILGQGMPWFTVFSPFGRAVAEVLSGLGMTPARAVGVHTVVWWVHAALALSFVAYVPYSKAMHMLVDAVNVLAADRSATLSLPGPAAGHAGYQEISDFTWKELLDLDACTKCGRCHEVCPARTGGAPLSPRDLVLDLRQWVDTSAGGITLFDRERRPERTGPLAKGDGVRVAGDVIDAATLWSCTTCMHCVEVCPVGIEHVPTIVQLRRALVDEGTMDSTLQQALQNLATQGNSFGKSARMRARWTRELDFEIPMPASSP
jgi:heterodisulfide reductase subunit C